MSEPIVLGVDTTLTGKDYPVVVTLDQQPPRAKGGSWFHPTNPR